MEQEILRLLKQEKDFISGAEMGKRLGVSRNAVWKTIQKLRSLGYHIESVKHKGYHLLYSPMLYHETELKSNINTHFIGNEIVFLEETDSTNTQAKKFAQAGKKEGLVVVAERQTNGRGRRARQWISPQDTGIWMSILLCPNIEPMQTPMLTLLAAIAVCRAIRRVTALPAMIKWPNDLFINNKKVCGILTELSGELETIHSVVIGIGINVNMETFPNDLKETATSLRIENGNHVISRSCLFQAVLQEFEPIYETYLAEGFFPFFQEYTDLCATLGN